MSSDVDGCYREAVEWHLGGAGLGRGPRPTMGRETLDGREVGCLMFDGE